MDGENTHKGNKRVVVKLIEYVLEAIQKPSLFISIFILFELFPVYSLSLKNTRNLIEDKNLSLMFVRERGEGINSSCKKAKIIHNRLYRKVYVFL